MTLVVPPKAVTVKFVGGPWDGRTEQAQTVGMDMVNVPLTWSVKIGGEDGAVIHHIYYLVSMTEYPNSSTTVVFQTLA